MDELHNTLPENPPGDNINQTDSPDIVNSGNKSSKREKYIKYGIVIALMTVVIIIVTGVISGYTGYRAVVDNYFNAINNKDINAYSDLKPEFVMELSQISMPAGYDVKSEIQRQFTYTDELLKAEYGNDYKITYNITDTEDYDKDDLNVLTRAIRKRCNSCNLSFDKTDISEAKRITVEITVRSDDADGKSEATMTLIKYRGDWKIYSGGII